MFDISWEMPYTNRLVLDIRFCFTFGLWKLYQNFVKVSNIMGRVADLDKWFAFNIEQKVDLILALRH